MVVALVLLLVTSAFLGVWLVPQWQVRREMASLTPKDRLELVNEYRRTVAQIVGGGAVLAGLFFTWQQLLTTYQTLDLTRNAELNARFTKAIEQLSDAKRPIRIGGLYALQQLAAASPEKRTPVLQVVSSFLAEAARYEEGSDYERPDEDVQVGIMILAAVPRGTVLVSLRGLDLRGVRLVQADLRNMDLTDVHFDHGDLSHSDLTGSTLFGARFDGATMESAQLGAAKLAGAYFRGARLTKASLKGADLRGANFTGATLADADLSGSLVGEACFSGVTIRGARIQGVNFTDARGISESDTRLASFDATTIKPPSLKRCQ